MANDDKTITSENCLRYKSKKAGSPFTGRGTTGGTMSCIKCGQHKPRKHGAFKRMFGNSTMFVCFDCKPPQTEAATND